MDDRRRPGAEGPERVQHPLARAALAAAGSLLVVVGVVLLVLPGPGLLLVLAGLILLSRAVPAVARFVEPVRVRAMNGAEASVASRWRILCSALVGLGLIGAGVAWGLVPVLPFSSWSTGGGLIVSGIILLVLLHWSHRRVHSTRR